MAVLEADVPLAMRKVYRRLQRWRGQRKGRERIPQRLWVAAGKLAREHGVNPVSRVLGLDFNRLKRMVESKGTPARRRHAPAFVELIAPQAMASPHCVNELEGQRGKVRIEWRGTAGDLASFSQALWEMIA